MFHTWNGILLGYIHVKYFMDYLDQVKVPDWIKITDFWKFLLHPDDPITFIKKNLEVYFLQHLLWAEMA